MCGSAPTSQMGGAGPLEGGAYRGGVQAGLEGASACWHSLDSGNWLGETGEVELGGVATG